MARGIFIAGTDTGVGKTLVAAAVARMLRARAIDAAPMKPAQTGGEPDRARPGRLIAPDLEFALAACGLSPGDEERALMAPWLFEPACSPHLAARLAGRSIEVAKISDCFERLAARHRCLVVEGAGGLLVPLNETETMLDLMRALALPVLIVARGGLGTINHTLLSIRACREAGLNVLGFAVNDAEPAGGGGELARTIRQDNPRAIERFAQAPLLGDFGHHPEIARSPGRAEAWRPFEHEFFGFDEILRGIETA